MTTRRIRVFSALLAVVAVLLASLVVAVAPANAQEDVYETCARYRTIIGTGGQGAADAAAELQALGAPNPFGLDNVLEVIINAESDVPPIGSRPADGALLVAMDELPNYFGLVCDTLDVCPLIRQAVAANDASSAEAARLARRITAPAPPGIGAALAVIAGELDESTPHGSVAQAQAQVAAYFPCDVDAGDVDAGEEDAGDAMLEADRDAGSGDAGSSDAGSTDAGTVLAFTGTTSGPLALLGVSLVASGAGVMHVRRRLLDGQV